jgi:hypothetical protein
VDITAFMYPTFQPKPDDGIAPLSLVKSRVRVDLRLLKRFLLREGTQALLLCSKNTTGAYKNWWNAYVLFDMSDQSIQPDNPTFQRCLQLCEDFIGLSFEGCSLCCP